MMTDAPDGTSANVSDGHGPVAPHDDLHAAAADPFRRLVQQAGHLLWTATADGLAGAEQGWYAYTGQRPDEVTGWGWLAAIHPDDRPQTRAWAGQSGYEMEHRIRRADGVYRTFLTRGTPILDPDGRARAWAVFAADITPRAGAAAALDALLEMAQAIVQRLGLLMREVLGCRSVGLIAVSARNELRPLECAGLAR